MAAVICQSASLPFVVTKRTWLATAAPASASAGMYAAGMSQPREWDRRRSGKDRQKCRNTTGRNRIASVADHSSVQSARFSLPVYEVEYIRKNRRQIA